MSFDNRKDYILFELEYKPSTKDQTKIFGSMFVNENKDKCKIIYKNQEYELTENFEDIDNNYNNNNILIKFKLRINNNITNISFMFSGCKALLSIKNITESDDSNINNIYESSSENNSNIFNGKFNNSKGIEKGEIFYGDNSILSTIQLKQSTFNSIEINKIINNGNYLSKQIFCDITNMSSMFYECSSLISLSDISKWNRKNVTNMSWMFYECSSLSSLPDISKWKSNNIKEIVHMFTGCTSLISLPDISKCNFIEDKNISKMFSGCISLAYIPDLSKRKFFICIGKNDVFNDCLSLINFPDIPLNELSSFCNSIHDFGRNDNNSFTIICSSAFFIRNGRNNEKKKKNSFKY